MGRKVSSINHILPNQALGSDLTILDVMDITYKENGHNQNVMLIIYKDDRDMKQIMTIRDPKILLYFVKPELRNFTTPREYFPVEDCYTIETTEKRKNRTIYEEMTRFDDPITIDILNKVDECRSIARQSQDAWKLFRAADDIVNSWPYVLFSDVPVEEYYRIMLGYQYNQMRSHTIDKVYMDIENDVYGLTTTECRVLNMDPVNACTLIFRFDKNGARKDQKTKVITFALWNPDRYRGQSELCQNIDKFYEECHRRFDKQTIIKGGEKKIIDTPADYDLRFYDDESKMLIDIFRTINQYKPDVCNVWNIEYDIPKIANRLRHYDLDPAQIMSDPMIPSVLRRYIEKLDRRPIEPADKTTNIRVTSTTLFNDQMQTYAAIRRGRKAYGSVSLDNISMIELGMGKLKFPNGVDVTNAAIFEYWLFLLYNIRDVWCQVLVDDVTNDTMSMVYNMNQSFTPLKNLYKQVTYQRQIYYTQRLKRNHVSGNNPNKNYVEIFKKRLMGNNGPTEEELKEERRKLLYRQAYMEHIDNGGDPDDFQFNMDDSEDDLEAIAALETGKAIDIFEDSPNRKLYLMGGMVGNPDNNLPNGTELIDGVPSKHIFDDVLDMDFASEYPWAKYTRSLSKSTQFGRLIIPHRVSERQYQLPLGQQKREKDAIYYTSGSEFVSDYLSGDIISLGNVWFNLPSVADIVKKYHEQKGETKYGYIAGQIVHNFDPTRFKSQIQKVVLAQQNAHAML